MMAFVVGVPGGVAAEMAPLLAVFAVPVAASLDTAEVPELASWLALPSDTAVLAAVLFMLIGALIGIVWCLQLGRCEW